MKKRTAKTGWLRRLYHRTLKWSTTRNAKSALFGITLIESAVFPFPPDALFIPLVLKNRSKAFQIATIGILGSLTGVLLGYLLGWFFFEAIGSGMIHFYKLGPALEVVRLKFIENTFLTIVTAAFTPIPYMVFTIAAGLFRVPIFLLLGASLVGRALRFYVEAWLLVAYGKQIQSYLEKNLITFTIGFFALIIILIFIFNLWL